MGNKNSMYNQGGWNMGCDTGCAEPVAACGCADPVNTCGCEAAAASVRCGCETAAVTGHCGCTHECGNETHIIYEACDGYKEVTVTGNCQESAAPGRVLDVTATLTNVCPGRRSALGLTLTELDAGGIERPCGFQAVSVPAHNGRCNQDITVDTVRFVLPEDGCQQQRRHFIVRTQHHYLDPAGIWNNAWGR